jgi:tetratricopeptide (TPR) repeat protein
MELVRGRRLDQWARDRRPDLKQRLQMLIEICDAVQHAHQQGVIHRDLKPSNILVTEQNRPKILDFGVATAVRGNGASAPVETLHTATGQIVGTLQYMSPEQVAGDARSLDTRSDVYALGVIGYQLLSDRLPYDVSDKTIPQAMRVIQDEQPSRLGTIDRNLRGDLETIVFKALAKEKQQRYGSCAELGADVKRYLNYEPITARPPSAWYQARKFARRNKTLVGAAALLMIVLIAGVTVSTIALFDARRSRRDALDRLEEAEGARQAAEQVSRFLMFLLQPDPGQPPGTDVTVRQVLERANQIVTDQLSDQPLVEAELRRTIGRIYGSMGEIDTAQRQLERSIELLRGVLGDQHVRTIIVRDELSRMLTQAGRTVEAGKVYRELLAGARRTLGEDHAATLNVMDNLALNLDNQGLLDEALALHREALDRRRRTQGDDHPDTVQSLHNLGSSLMLAGDFAQAAAMFEQATQKRRQLLGAEHPLALVSAAAWGDALVKLGRPEEAEPLLREAADKAPSAGIPPRQLCMTLLGYAACLRQLGKLDEAQQTLLSARDLLGNGDTTNVGQRRDVLRALIELSEQSGRTDDAARWRAELAALPSVEQK